MKAPERITHAYIAQIAGVHRSTVSLALKGHPTIPKATQEQIRALAQKLGYQPDPMLSALAAYRHRQTPSTFHGTIAWLGNSKEGFHWKQFPLYNEYFEGACAAAQRYGYHLEVFDLGEPRMSPERLTGIFLARNITGILLPPQPNPGTRIDFTWERFSAVTFGYTLAEPQLHMVTATQFRAMVTTMGKLRERGYKRIAFAYAATHDERTDHNYIAGYLLEAHLHQLPVLIPPALDYSNRKGEFFRWLEKEKPDAVVTGDYRMADILQRSGIPIPEKLGVACPSLPDETVGVAGVHENTRRVGEIALEFLTALVQRGERGLPHPPQRLLVEGEWVEGRTLRPNKSD